jgi:hypothetical protein
MSFISVRSQSPRAIKPDATSNSAFLINHVFMGESAPNPYQAGNANCDGGVNVGDAVCLINFIFKSGPPPCCP